MDRFLDRRRGTPHRTRRCRSFPPLPESPTDDAVADAAEEEFRAIGLTREILTAGLNASGWPVCPPSTGFSRLSQTRGREFSHLPHYPEHGWPAKMPVDGAGLKRPIPKGFGGHNLTHKLPRTEYR